MYNATPLQLLYRVCTFTNCFPPFDFATLSVRAQHNHVVYTLVLTCLVVAQFAVSTYGRCAILKMEFSVLIADTFANISLCGCNVICFLLCYYIGNKYGNQLILLHAHIDTKLGGTTETVAARNEFDDSIGTTQVRLKSGRQNGGEEAKQSHGRSAPIRSYNQPGKQHTNVYNCKLYVLILVHAVFIALIAVDIYVRLHHFYDGAIYYYMFMYLQYYCVTTLFLYAIFAAKQIQELVAYVSNKLVAHLNSFLLLPAAELRESKRGLFTVTGWTRCALNTRANPKDIKCVVEASQQYKDLYLLCYYYNVIFGWPLLFVLGVVFFELIEAMNFAVQYPHEHVSNNAWMLCQQVLTAAYFYALQTWMILSCHNVTEEVASFANAIYKRILVMSDAQASLTEQLVLDELISLWYQVTNNRPSFHAGFISLGRKFIYGSFIGISSFIAVIVEFNRVVSNHHGYPVKDKG